MQINFEQLARCPLFSGSREQEIQGMLDCLDARHRIFLAKALIFEAGSEVFELGIVLNGSVDIVQEDYWGGQTMLARLMPGQIFAESFALAQTPRLPVSVVAAEASEVLLLDYRRMLRTCTRVCPHHERLIHNLLFTMAQKNAYLTQKMEIMAKRTIRDKLLAFLSAEAQRASSKRFSIPYDRQALADYLAVDRSALSRTIGSMQKEGILKTSKHHFELL